MKMIINSDSILKVRLPSLKKAAFLIFISLSLIVNSQIINFDDLNFKTVLLASGPDNFIALDASNNKISIDANNNNEIEVEEVLIVDRLNVPLNSNVSSLNGIEFFTNLSKLICFSNLLTSIDVSMLTNLELLELNDNQIAQIDVSMLTNLMVLRIQDNLITALDVSMLENLTAVNVARNQLNSLYINPQLSNLDCSNNNLSVIDLSQSTALNDIDCSDNNLTTLNLSNMSSLRNLICSNNILEELIITDLELNHIACDNNFLSEIDFSGVGNSSFGTLSISCENNLFSNIDVTTTANDRVRLLCGNNQNLISMYLKNGEVFDDTINEFIPPGPSVYFENNVNLEFICADDFNFQYLEDKFLDYNLTGITLTSDCTLGVSEFENFDFTVYTDPFKETLTIDCPRTYNNLSIYNIIGQFIFNTKFQPLQPISLDFLKSGQYIIKLYSESDIYESMFIKQ